MNRTPLLVGLTIAALFAALQVIFIVREGEVAVVTRLGKPERAITEAGLYTRWPWPVQRVHRFDARIRALQGSYEETLTGDGKNGEVAFAQLVNIDPAALRHDQIEQRVAEAVRPEAEKRYGIEVLFVGLRKLGLPEAITQSVFERMRAEREELAERYRSEGEGEAVRIRAQADSERDQVLARADAEARRLRAEGEAEAAAHYQVFSEEPGLALFLRKLDALRETLGEKSTVVLSADTEPFDLLLPETPAGATAPKSTERRP